MKKIIVALAIFAAIVSACLIFQDELNSFADTMFAEKQQVVENSTPAPATNDSTPEPSQATEEPGNTSTKEEKSDFEVYTDKETGKTYFVGSKAFENATAGELQTRVDMAIMNQYKVYDIVREGDEIVEIDDVEIDSMYDFAKNELPEKVEILRNGYRMLTWHEENFKLSDDAEKKFVSAQDSKFTSRVYCKEHKAVHSFENVGYPNAREVYDANTKEYGYRGEFVTTKISDVFQAFVLVERQIEVNGKQVEAYTWCVRICGCEDDNTVNNQPAAKPSKKPTAESTPTPKPTEEPTEEPTQEPTEEPTPKPTEEPTPTPKPIPPADDTPSYSPEKGDDEVYGDVPAYSPEKDEEEVYGGKEAEVSKDDSDILNRDEESHYPGYSAPKVDVYSEVVTATEEYTSKKEADVEATVSSDTGIFNRE